MPALAPPNPWAVFDRDKVIHNMKDETAARYTRAVGPRPFYGESTKDFDRDHSVGGWPPGTEYQYAYCSNYRPILEDCQNKVPQIIAVAASTNAPPNTHPLYQLYENTPLPVIDQRTSGASYHPNDPVGTMVPEELTKVRHTTFGPRNMSHKDVHQSTFVPNYRYKNYVERPLDKVMMDNERQESNIVCQVPPTMTKYYDFYNMVRMNRPKHKVDMGDQYSTSRYTPLPMDKDMPSIPPVEAQPHLGKFNNYVKTEDNNSFSERVAGPLTDAF